MVDCADCVPDVNKPASRKSEEARLSESLEQRERERETRRQEDKQLLFFSVQEKAKLPRQVSCYEDSLLGYRLFSSGLTDHSSAVQLDVSKEGRRRLDKL